MSWDSCYHCESKPWIACWKMRNRGCWSQLKLTSISQWCSNFFQLNTQLHHVDRLKLIWEWILTCLCGSKYFLNFISSSMGPNSAYFSTVEVPKFLKSFLFSFIPTCKLATFFWACLLLLIHFLTKSPATETHYQYLFSKLYI